MDGDEEAVGAGVVELLALALVGFVARLPHAEAIVGLSIPVADVPQHDLLVGIVALDAIEYNFASSSLGGCGCAHLISLDCPGFPNLRCVRVARRAPVDLNLRCVRVARRAPVDLNLRAGLELAPGDVQTP